MSETDFHNAIVYAAAQARHELIPDREIMAALSLTAQDLDRLDPAINRVLAQIRAEEPK